MTNFKKLTRVIDSLNNSESPLIEDKVALDAALKQFGLTWYETNSEDGELYYVSEDGTADYDSIVESIENRFPQLRGNVYSEFDAITIQDPTGKFI